MSVTGTTGTRKTNRTKAATSVVTTFVLRLTSQIVPVARFTPTHQNGLAMLARSGESVDIIRIEQNGGRISDFTRRGAYVPSRGITGYESLSESCKLCNRKKGLARICVWAGRDSNPWPPDYQSGALAKLPPLHED